MAWYPRRSPHRPGLWTWGPRIWAFTKVRWDDDCRGDDDDVSYRQVVVHVYGLHILLEWSL